MFEQKNAVKTKESMKELLKIQSERLKVLNQNYKELELERKRTYKEMMYFKNQCKKKTSKINKAINYMQDNSGINTDDPVSLINFYKDLMQILRGD